MTQQAGLPPLREETTPSTSEELLEGEELAPPGVRTMAIVRWGLVTVMAFAALGSILHYFDKLPAAASKPSAKRYHCPMHPSVVQDQPGDCPICGMSLVPVEGSGSGKPAPARSGHAAAAHSKDKPAGGAVYACPMHPDQTSADPNARCAICKMKLKRRKVAPGTEQTPSRAEQHRVPGVTAVDLPEGRVQLIGRKTARVGRGSRSTGSHRPPSTSRCTKAPELSRSARIVVDGRGRASTAS